MSYFRVYSSSVSLALEAQKFNPTFSDQGVVTHLLFVYSAVQGGSAGESALVLATATVDAWWRGKKIIDGWTLEQLIGDADHGGGAVQYVDASTSASGVTNCIFACPIGAINVEGNDHLEVMVTLPAIGAGTNRAQSLEVGVGNAGADFETGVIVRSRKDKVLSASQKDDVILEGKGIFNVFVQDKSLHIASIYIPRANVDSNGSMGLYKALSMANANLSSVGSSATFWNYLFRVWSSAPVNAVDKVTFSVTADGTGGTFPFLVQSLDVDESRVNRSVRLMPRKVISGEAMKARKVQNLARALN